MNKFLTISRLKAWIQFEKTFEIFCKHTFKSVKELCFSPIFFQFKVTHKTVTASMIRWFYRTRRSNCSTYRIYSVKVYAVRVANKLRHFSNTKCSQYIKYKRKRRMNAVERRRDSNMRFPHQFIFKSGIPVEYITFESTWVTSFCRTPCVLTVLTASYYWLALDRWP